MKFENIAKYYKPHFQEITIENDLTNVQAKLEKLFNRSLLQEILTSEINISGKFTNSEKTKFKIVQTIGIYTTGGNLPYYGQIISISPTITKIKLTNNSHIGLIIFTSFLFVLILPIFLLYTYLDIIKPIELFGFLIFFLMCSYPLTRLVKFTKENIHKDLEKVLKTEN